ncbi:hypothetical protein EB796_004725 [Bugula neritina]|uniref:Uncharacterized protein n=1 Tax=Bugula neritina TaxID=10212 RepID=A0A7J7KGF5_BUGNE|nr:hypothetical protein EB796_004725 [Bugula neritina]
MPRRKKEVEFSKEKILQELGIGEAPVIEKERPKLVEELLTARTYHKDNDPIIVNKTSFFDKILMSTGGAPEQSKQLPQISAAVTPSSKERLSRVGGRSVDSVNTDVLLQSTEEFMKAIHSFSSQSESPKPPSGKSKPSLRQSSSGSIKKSAVDRLSSTSTSSKADEVGGEPATSRASQPTTPRATMSARRSQSDSKTASRPLNGAKRSQSMKDSDNGGSLESVNNIKNLSSSNGRVGPLSSSRPNRTFELRRARTESLENENSTASLLSFVLFPYTCIDTCTYVCIYVCMYEYVYMYIHCMSLTYRASGRSARSLDPSEVSLGTKIVQKSRENGALSADSKGAPIRRLTKQASVLNSRKSAISASLLVLSIIIC